MEQLILVKTLSQLTELKEYIKDKDYIAFDTETTGLKKESKIVGFSIAAEEDVGYYVVLRYWDKDKHQLIDLETVPHAAEFMTGLLNKKLIMHNAVFDCGMVYNNYRVSLIDALHTDTMILAHLLDENRPKGLKELGVSFFGEDAKSEKLEVAESVKRNGGKLTKICYELYKAEMDILGKYGAKDAILTIKMFYTLVDQLFDQNLDKFFYDHESMPLLRGPTYHLNTVGMKVDMEGLRKLKGELEADCMAAKAYIHNEITPLVSEKYPSTKKTNEFNIQASKQIAWLLFVKLGNEFSNLTDEGKEVCKSLGIKIPYAPKAKRDFITTITRCKGDIYQQPVFNHKTGKMSRPKKVADVANYIAADSDTLKLFSTKYKWVARLLEYNKNKKLLTTYVEAILRKTDYGVIYPSFNQSGTTSGRYSSKDPNFQNLPRDDKRIKKCIVARPGKVFVGADYSQLEPRVFASFSNDERLLNCFKNGEDFYSVIGAEVYNVKGCSLKKSDKDSFAALYPKYRQVAKEVALAATYGTTAPQMATILGMKRDEAQEVIDNYFKAFPSVKKFMLKSHEIIKAEGKIGNLFGRLRRIPKAMLIHKICGTTKHGDLPYEMRSLLNLSVNHQIQSTGACIMNRAAIAFLNGVKDKALTDSRWKDVNLVLQIHDELIIEGPESLATDMSALLKNTMENTVTLPNVKLIAEPVIGKSLAELK